MLSSCACRIVPVSPPLGAMASIHIIPALRPGWYITLLLLGFVSTSCGLKTANPLPHSHDHFVGWFQTDSQTKPQRLLPVIRRGDDFFSICHGREIPLRCVADGLEWNDNPSSMTGTKIGYNTTTKTYYLSVHDALASEHSDGRYGTGEPQPLARTAAPASGREKRDPPPATHADVVGWYQPQFLPWWKIGIVRTNDTYSYLSYEIRAAESGGWQTEAPGTEATPLADQAGFTFLAGREPMRLIYNASAQRYELVFRQAEVSTRFLVMPLNRIPAPHAADPAPDQQGVIGIPAWR